LKTSRTYFFIAVVKKGLLLPLTM